MISLALTLIAFLIIAVFALWAVIIASGSLIHLFSGEVDGSAIFTWTMLAGTLFLWWIGLH